MPTNDNVKPEKIKGKIFTPKFIVNNILDMANYSKKNILKKHVIDNSCGDGAFLTEIVKRYCETAIDNEFSKDEIKNDLEKYIHGIDIDENETIECIKNLNEITSTYNIKNVMWDIICDNALLVNKYNGKMDYVFGNPPYVRVHNLGSIYNSVKEFSFASNGMTDLYIVFYEIGIKMLSKKGKLGYITPSSFFNSVAGQKIRKVLVENNLIESICDLKHYQAFNATTYTTIVILNSNKLNWDISFHLYDSNSKKPFLVDVLKPNDFYISGKFYFNQKEKLALLSKILLNFGKSGIRVKNGYATLCDNVFISDFKFKSKYIIPVVKSSRGITKKIFYPYDNNGVLVPEYELKKDKNLYDYILSNKDSLLKRNNEKNDNKYWYAFGRSQAIADTYKEKLSINSLIRTKDDFKFISAPKGVGVYGGLYVISDNISMQKIKNALQSQEFIDYIYMLGKYKSGGYYTFSSKDVEKFLDYKFSYDGGLFSCLQTSNF